MIDINLLNNYSIYQHSHQSLLILKICSNLQLNFTLK